MDAVKFIQERNRMCSFYSKSDTMDCSDCPVKTTECCDINNMTSEIVSIVEKWSAEHPRKTRQSVFLEQWPDAEVDGDGVLNICPTKVCAKKECKAPERGCPYCRREFWMQEVE